MVHPLFMVLACHFHVVFPDSLWGINALPSPYTDSLEKEGSSRFYFQKPHRAQAGGAGLQIKRFLKIHFIEILKAYRSFHSVRKVN